MPWRRAPLLISTKKLDRSGACSLRTLIDKGKCAHREKGKAMRRGPTSGDRAGENAGKVALEPALGDKVFHRAAHPTRAVAIVEAAFEKGFENAGSAEMLSVELGPFSKTP